jgi:putative endonuclease
MQPAIYILANFKNGAIYTGVTSDLQKRIYQHKIGYYEGFTEKYNCKSLVYFELLDRMENALFREKQIKGGSRKDKIKLIEGFNPEWLDLYDEL